MTRIRLLLATLLCLASLNAPAHTRLATSVPADGAVLTQSPASMKLGFSAAVRVVKVTLTDSAGAVVAIDSPDAGTPVSELEIPLPELPAGDYALDWVVMGQDTHKVGGTLRFTLRPAQ